jgi:hypothetical protein
MTKNVDLKHYRVPKYVKIGGFNYEVVFPYIFGESSSYLGLHSTEDLKIFLTPHATVDELLPRTKVHEALLHEIIHGVDAVYFEDNMDHGQLYLLSNTLHQVLHDNELNIKNTKKPLPKKVKIFGMDYKIILWEFTEVDSNSSALEDTCSIKISKDLSNLNYQRAQLVFCIVAIVYCKLRLFDSEISKNSEENNRNFRVFARGLYQVIVDNDLERIMKDA